MPLIHIRTPHLEWSSEAPRHWLDGQPFASHFMNGLSSVFPDGEAFFVRSVLRFRDQIDDPELLLQIQAFAGQEGHHSNEHAKHVDLLVHQGYTALRAQNALLRRVTRFSVRRLPRLSLASTAALEHLTAILARRLLSEHEYWTGMMDSSMALLWQWHATEEAEHKAVAFDVLMRIAPSHGLRAWALASNTVALFVEVVGRVVYMLWKDRLLFRPSVWRDGWTFLFGKRGCLRGLGPHYWPWYRRDFHPLDIDDQPLIEAFEARNRGAFAPRVAVGGR
ncbi:MAG: metal-dependent hydrolase [Myxococcales bacterium]|nr:metal-dependent hydrolase [Myxococcales bacterium]